MTTLLVQLSDPHIVAEGELLMPEVDTAAALAHAVDRIVHLSTPATKVLVSGDLVNSGRVEQYEHLRRLLDPLGDRVVLLPGNHDDRDALRAVFPDHPELGSGSTCDAVVDLGDVDLVLLDTLVVGEPGGSLTAEQLAWLVERLDENADRPRLIAMHHPPFLTGIAHMDTMGLDPRSRDDLEEIVAARRGILGVVAGHLHRCIVTSWAGTVAMTGPGSAHSIALDLRERGVPAWTDEAPGMLLHRFRDGRLVSHLQTLGDFTAHPFS